MLDSLTKWRPQASLTFRQYASSPVTVKFLGFPPNARLSFNSVTLRKCRFPFSTLFLRQCYFRFSHDFGLPPSFFLGGEPGTFYSPIASSSLTLSFFKLPSRRRFRSTPTCLLLFFLMKVPSRSSTLPWSFLEGDPALAAPRFFTFSNPTLLLTMCSSRCELCTLRFSSSEPPLFIVLILELSIFFPSGPRTEPRGTPQAF